MQISFQHRRRGIVGDCRQMKVDVDSYNDAHPDAEPIQIVFDFTMDLAELDLASWLGSRGRLGWFIAWTPDTRNRSRPYP
jgi:hypothetical protein